jgi:predicted Rossmann fold flavoprotein
MGFTLHPRWSWIGLLRLSTATVAALPISKMPRIAVIGGGASGIFSAIQAATSSIPGQVIVLEAGPSTLGKVKISGGGRCNVLHDTTKSLGDILGSYPRGNKELRGLYTKYFTPQQAREWFTKQGVQLKTEDDGRMFPTTDSSQTIIDVLLNAANQAGVEIWKQRKVLSISKSDSSGKFRLKCKDDFHEEYDAVILATGSSQAGHELAKSLGHTIIDPVPSLFTFNTKLQVKEGGILFELSGVSVPLARVTLKVKREGNDKKQTFSQEGPLLITHNGISGPATLRLSAFAAREFHKLQYRGEVMIHWAPDLGSTTEITEKLIKYKLILPKRSVSTSCPLQTDSDRAIPRRLWSNLVAEAGIEKDTTWGEVPHRDLGKLARMVSECTLTLTGKSVFKDEFVTAGGVALREINMKTMESKICPGLFLCGEVIDVDGVTGGFNFMNCWSTGFIAGNGAATFCR